jgi:tetratricopeptide (TPR) repeat protein
LLAGQEAAAAFAFEEAARQYRRALELVEANSDLDRELLAAERLGSVLDLVGRKDEALRILERAESRCRERGDLEAAGRLVAVKGMVHLNRGSPHKGLASVESSLELLRSRGPSEAMARLHLTRAHLLFFVGKYRAMQTEAEIAGETARAVGADQLLPAIEDRRAVALLNLGRADEACRIYESAIPMIEASGDAVLLRRALGNLGVAHERLGDLSASAAVTERALTLAEQVGRPVQLAQALGNLSSYLITIGKWPAALRHLERALSILGPYRGTHASNPLSILGLLALRRGRCEEAQHLLDEALNLTDDGRSRIVREYVLTYLAELDIVRGKPKRAIERLEPQTRDSDSALVMFPVLARAHLEAGAEAEATALASRTVCRARREGQRVVLADALWVQGMVSVRCRRFPEATETFGEALEVARALPLPYTEARILEQQGIQAALEEEHERFRARVSDALAIFRRLGAEKDITRCVEILQTNASRSEA